MKKLYKNFLTICILDIVCAACLFAVGIANIALSVKLILLPLEVVCNIAVIWCTYRVAKKLAEEYDRLIKEKIEKAKKINTILDIYAILGIPPQYKQDGTIKDVYELLGIEPVYDENGNRKLTIYELLGINPLFTSAGEEIPYVVCIKNRARALVKLSKAPQPLTYKPRAKGEEKIKQEQVVAAQKCATILGPVVKVTTPAAAPKKPSKAGPKLDYGKAPKGPERKFNTKLPKLSYKPKESAKIVPFVFAIGNHAKNKLAAVIKPELKPKVEKVVVVAPPARQPVAAQPKPRPIAMEAASNKTPAVSVTLVELERKDRQQSSSTIIYHSKNPIKIQDDSGFGRG
jgi:hypothetical protein